VLKKINQIHGKCKLKKVVQVPDLGDANDVEVIEVCVKKGDVVSAEDPLIVLESEKAAMEVPSPDAGKVIDIKIALGDQVSKGDSIVEIEFEEAKTSPRSAQSKNINTDESKAIQSIPIPDLGDAEDVEVIELCVKVGDQVNQDDSIIVLESEKAAMEVPTPVEGTIKKINVDIGDKVSAGNIFLEVETIASSLPILDKEITPPETEVPAEGDVHINTGAIHNEAQPVTQSKFNVYAGPAVRKLAREFGIDLNLIQPTGPKGRILKTDLHNFVQKKLSGQESSEFKFNQPNVDYSKWGKIEEKSFTKFERTALKNLHNSWINIPHVTQHHEIDFSLISGIRKSKKKENINISPLAFIVYAVSNLLKDFPLLNSSLNESMDGYITKDYVNIGIAVDTERGLMVPNIKNTNKLSVQEISENINELAQKAKSKKIKPEDLKGATFSISSLGNIGGGFFTPIINPPEVAILGLSKTYQKPYLSSSESFKEKEVLPISLSYDHRLINGVYGAQFVTSLDAILQDNKLFEKI
jgi:pyruvate dehydrogenase E2 component (dihydrolipoamide acetyltransferase)